MVTTCHRRFCGAPAIAFDADRDPRLASYLPEGGLMGAIKAVHERLALAPITVTVQDGSGRPQAVVLGMEDFQLALTSHPQDGVDWPAFILSIYHGHYDEWAREVIDQRAAGSQGLIRAADRHQHGRVARATASSTYRSGDRLARDLGF